MLRCVYEGMDSIYRAASRFLVEQSDDVFYFYTTNNNKQQVRKRTF